MPDGRNLARPLCHGRIRELAEVVASIVRDNVVEDVPSATSTYQHIRGWLDTGPGPFAVLADCLPSDCVDKSEKCRIADDKWEEWLQVCWGNDSDFLTLLALLKNPEGVSEAEFIEYARQLPIVQEPVGAMAASPVPTDAHLHVGALCPPALRWAYYVAVGPTADIDNVAYRSIRGLAETEDEGRKIIDASAEMRRKSLAYIGVARILFAALLDCCQVPALSEITIDSDPTDILDHVALACSESSSTSRRSPRAQLQGKLATVLKSMPGGRTEYVDRSMEIAPFKLTDGIGYLEMERACFAKLLWQAYRNLLSPFLQEVLLTYLRCKNFWFQVSSGANILSTRAGGIGLAQFREIRSYAFIRRVETNRDFADKISGALDSMYASSTVGKLEVRLAQMDKHVLEPTLHWMRRTLSSKDWKLIISLRRHDFDFRARLPSDKEAYTTATIAFVDAILQQEAFRDKVSGIDVVGIEQYTNWDHIIPIMSRVRAHIETKVGRPCFVAFHCGEDTSTPLKGICDIWQVLTECPLAANDRVGHAIDLLRPINTSARGETTLFFDQWNSLRNRFDEFLLGDRDDHELRTQVRAPYRQLAQSAIVDPRFPIVHLSVEHANELAAILQPYVRNRLRERGVLIETCPTSNWRIAGLPLPTRHVIATWINEQGSYLVGTDDPAIFPCTIQSEHYAVAQSLAATAGEIVPP